MMFTMITLISSLHIYLAAMTLLSVFFFRALLMFVIRSNAVVYQIFFTVTAFLIHILMLLFTLKFMTCFSVII